jgi:hypothetical protein
MTFEQIANLLGTSPEALEELMKARASVISDNGVRQQAFIDEVMDAMEEATILFEDRSVAIHWLRGEQLDCFSGATGRDLLLAGRGSDLIRYIQSLQAGFVG